MLLHPLNAQIHSGQLFWFSAPKSLGMPTMVGIGTKAAISLHHVWHDKSFDEPDLSAYAACMELLPDDVSDDGQLSVTFGKESSTTLTTEQSVELIG